MTDIVTMADLPESMRSADFVEQMIAGANAQAARVAPCLVATDPAPSASQLAEAKLVLLGSITRWIDAGSGALSQRTEVKGPFTESQTFDTRQPVTGYRLWPSEIGQLQDICHNPTEAADAYMVDMTGLSSSSNPLDGSVVNADCTNVPMGQWSDNRWSWGS